VLRDGGNLPGVLHSGGVDCSADCRMECESEERRCKAFLGTVKQTESRPCCALLSVTTPSGRHAMPGARCGFLSRGQTREVEIWFAGEWHHLEAGAALFLKRVSQFHSSLARSLLRGFCDARRHCAVLLSGPLSQSKSGPLLQNARLGAWESRPLAQLRKV
jgi:hypothetical protein